MKTSQKSSAVIEEIHGQIIKAAAGGISKPLSCILNESFVHG